MRAGNVSVAWFIQSSTDVQVRTAPAVYRQAGARHKSFVAGQKQNRVEALQRRRRFIRVTFSVLLRVFTSRAYRRWPKLPTPGIITLQRILCGGTLAGRRAYWKLITAALAAE